MKNIVLSLLWLVLGGLVFNACNSNSKKVDPKAIYTQAEKDSNSNESQPSLNATQTGLESSQSPDQWLTPSDETEKLLYLIDERGARPIFTSLDEALANPENVFRLQLHAQHLNQLPKSITDLYNLEELYLTGNNLTALPDSFGIKLKGLKVLDLSDNKFQRLPDHVGELSNLVYLNVSSNQLNVLPTTLKGLKSLQILNIENNAFRAFPETISELTTLKYLFVQGIPLNKIPPQIAQLSQLTRISLINCRLTEISDELLALKDLERMILSRNQISTIPAGLGDLKQLNFLNLSDNRISGGLEPILRLENLLTLDLSSNPLENIPSDIFQKLNLKALNLSFTKISSLSTGISKSANLIWLALSGTLLQELPATITECRRLQVVQLGYNPQLNLSRTIRTLSSLPKLYALELREMSTPQAPLQLPDDLDKQLKSLIKLDLRGNRFADINAALDKISKISKLEALNLSDCGIRKNEEGFVKLSSLHLLGIDEKSMLPGEAAKLTQAIPQVKMVDGSEYFDYRF